MILFLDTSVLVKLYIEEPGSERMREEAGQGEPVAVSVLAFAEIHATFSRRRREELLVDAELEQLRLGFANDWDELKQVPVGAAVLKLVPALCKNHPSGRPMRSISRARCFCTRKGWRFASLAPTAIFWRRQPRRDLPPSILCVLILIRLGPGGLERCQDASSLLIRNSPHFYFRGDVPQQSNYLDLRFGLETRF